MPRGHGGGQMATLKLRVSGMTCGHCQAKVEQALKHAGGVYSAIVDLQAGEAEADFDDDAATTDPLLAVSGRAGSRAAVAGWSAPRRSWPGSTCLCPSARNRLARRSSSDSPT